MKELRIIIKPDKYMQVENVFKQYDINGMTVSQVMGCGAQRGISKRFVSNPSDEYHLLPKTQFAIVVNDDIADELVDKICDKLSDNDFGDGKIFVYEVADVIRIRTKEHGEDIL